MQTEKDLKKLHDVAPGKLYGTRVVDGNIDRAIRRFKKQIRDSGILQEVYQRREFTKPSLIRRNQIKSAQYKENRRTESK